MSNQPEQTIRDGNIKATIWRNEGSKGDFYTTDFSRTYKNENEELQDTTGMHHQDLLKISRLSQKAYDYILELKQAN